MATAIQRRRGNTAQHASFTGLAGEITIDTDKNTVVVHDGVTAGGYPLARADEVEALGGADITAVIAGSGLTGGASSGNATISLNYENLAGNLVPSANNTYSLGSIDKVWKDVYVGPGSLYVNGQKVLEDNNGTIVVSADSGQNLSIVTSGGGDLELSSGTTGDIQLKSNVTLAAGKTITASGGLKLSSNLDVNSQYINNVTNPVQAQDAATKGYVDGATYLSAGDGISKSTGQFSVDNTVVRTTGTQTIGGAKTFSADLVVSGNLTVSGTTTTVNSETISLADNIIDLNSNFTTGSPSENAGLRIKRGDSADVQLRWNEADDKWQFTNDGSTYQSMLTDATARALISVTDAGGDGSLSYNSSTGVLTYTGPSASEVRAHLSAGTGLTYSSGAFSITNSGVTAGVYGNGTQVPVLNVNAQGQVTSASNLTITPAITSVTGLASGMADFLAAGNAATFAGAVSGTTGTGNIVLANSPILVTPDLGTPSAVVLTNATNLKIEGIAAANLLTSGESFVDTDNQLMTAAAIDDRILSYGYTTNVGDITGVTAGNGLTGGGSSGDVTVNVVGGYGISVSADSVAVANADIRGLFSGSTGVSYDNTTGAFTLATGTAGSGLTYSSGVLAVGAGTGITVNADDIALSTSGVTAGTYGSASAVGQVVVDTYGRVTSASNVAISVSSSAVTDFTSAARTSISVTDAGGDGSLGYNSSTGVITYTGPSQAEANVRIDARLSAGTGISYSSGVIALSHLGIQSLTDPNADRILFWDDSAGAAAWLEVSTGLSLSGTALTNSGVTSITGTSNQVTASASTGGVTLSLPQNIHTGASPTFAGATLGSITKSGTDGVGDIGQSNNKFSTIYATTFSGSATTAKYADLAERYEADDILEPGTVVCFGGAKEITACDHPNDHAVAGVISTDPAYMMNSEAGPDSTHPYVALTGRVPVKVTGEVNKGDLLVASDVKGHAMANNNAKAGTIIGKALGASAGGEAVIEALVHLM